MWQRIAKWLTGELAELYGAGRSPKWAALSREHLTKFPRCEFCGNTNADDLVAHHVVPVHVAPDRELDPKNLVTLCDRSRVGGVTNCHLAIGHNGNWRDYNRNLFSVLVAWGRRSGH